MNHVGRAVLMLHAAGISVVEVDVSSRFRRGIPGVADL